MFERNIRLFLHVIFIVMLLLLLSVIVVTIANAQLAEPGWWRMCITEKGCLIGTWDGAYTWYLADGVGYTVEQYEQFREVSGDFVWAWGVIGAGY